MSRRRSLRHLTAIAAGSGLITLAVAITGVTPVWLAVGPLLLVTFDSIAYSPAVQSRAAALAAHLPRISLPLPAPEPDVAYSTMRHSRFPWLLALLVPLAVAAAAYLVSAAPLAVLLALGGVLVAAVVAGLSLAAARAYRAPAMSVGGVIVSLGASFGSSSNPAVPWLQEQLDAADSHLALAVLALPGPRSAATYVEALVRIARTTGVQVGKLSGIEFLLVASPDTVHAALSLLGEASPAPSAQVRVGEATYPQDGTSPTELLAKARQRAERSAS